jgi:hypothetical protein
LDFVGNERGFRRLVQTSVNLHLCIAKRASPPVQSLKGRLDLIAELSLRAV